MYLNSKLAKSNTTLQEYTYNPATISCELIKSPIDGQSCNISDIDNCGSYRKRIQYLCDITTQTCKRGSSRPCLEDNDCVSSFSCIYQKCQCVR